MFRAQALSNEHGFDKPLVVTCRMLGSLLSALPIPELSLKPSEQSPHWSSNMLGTPSKIRRSIFGGSKG